MSIERAARTGEEFKPVTGYEAAYEVSNFGRMWSMRKSIFMKCFQSPAGYWRVELMLSGIGQKFYVHRLVAREFVSNPNNKPQINHIDANKTNNFWSNLEWTTQRENLIHASKLGLMPDFSGINNPSAKFSWETIAEIRARYGLGQTSCAKLGKEFGTSASNIQCIVSGKTWKIKSPLNGAAGNQGIAP